MKDSVFFYQMNRHAVFLNMPEAFFLILNHFSKVRKMFGLSVSCYINLIKSSIVMEIGVASTTPSYRNYKK